MKKEKIVKSSGCVWKDLAIECPTSKRSKGGNHGRKQISKEQDEKRQKTTSKEKIMVKTRAKAIDKDVAKKLAELAPQTKKQLRYVALRNVEKRKAMGWKVAKETKDKHERTLGVRTNISEGSSDNKSDLVLMEK